MIAAAGQTHEPLDDRSERADHVLDPYDRDAPAARRRMISHEIDDLGIRQPARDLVERGASRGRVASARASSSRFRVSRPSSPARRLASRSSPVSVEHVRRQRRSSPAADARAPCWAATSTFSNTVMPSNGRGTWYVRPIPSRQRRAASSGVIARPSNAHLPGIGRKVARDDAEQARLAGSVGPDDAERITGPNREREVVGDDHPPEPLRDAIQLEESRATIQAFVGWRSPPTATSGLRLLSTTTISHGNFVPFFHWTPSGRMMPIPGCGPLAKSSGPQIPV